MSLLHRFILVPLRRGPWSKQRVAIVREYLVARKQFAKWQGWGEERRRRFRLEALRTVVRHAAASVPFYQRRFRDVGFDPAAAFDFDDYAKLPPLEKADIREHLEHLSSRSVPQHLVRTDSTGGSTGARVRFRVGPKDLAWRWATDEHTYEKIGFRRGEPLAMIWGAQLEPELQDSWKTRASNWMLNQRVFNCFRLDDESLFQMHRDMSILRPAFIFAYATAVARFARFLLDRGLRAGYPSRGILTGAEKLDPGDRADLESAFECHILESYGSRDCGMMACQLEPSGPLEVVDIDVLLEPSAPEPNSAETDILVTRLHTDAMPLLRYRVGDRAEFPDVEPGAVTRLPTITGRVLQHLPMPSGRVLHATQFPHMFKDFAIREYQVVQREAGDVDIYLAGEPGLDEPQLRQIESMLRTMITEVPWRIHRVDRVERSASGKLVPVVSQAKLK